MISRRTSRPWPTSVARWLNSTESQALARLGSWEWDIATGSMLWSDELYRLHGVNPVLFRNTYENALVNRPR